MRRPGACSPSFPATFEQPRERQNPPESSEDSWRGQIFLDCAHNCERIKLIEANGGLNPAALQGQPSVGHEERRNWGRKWMDKSKIAVTELTTRNSIRKVLGFHQVEAYL
jgi:hypothetical protein